MASKEDRYKDPLVALNACNNWGQQLLGILREQMKDLTGNKIKDTDFEFRVFEVIEQLPLFTETADARSA